MKFRSVFKSREVQNAGWLIGGKVAQMVLSLFVGLLSARYLGPSNYGLISYGNALIALFMSLCTLGINSVIVKELLDNPQSQGEALGTAIFLRVLSSFLSALMAISVSLILDYGQWETVIVVAMCSVSLVFHAFDTISYWFQARYQSKILALITFAAYVATSIYKIALLILQKSVFWFAFASSVDYIVLAALLLWAYRKNGGTPFRFSLTKGRKILSKSYHYILSGMMVAIYGQTDKLMLKQLLSESEVGYYTIATTLCGMWTFILSAVIDSMYPTLVRAYQQDKALFAKRNRQLYAIVFYLSVCASLGFTVLGNWIVKLLYGAEYLPAVIPLRVVTWYTAFSYLGVARNAWMVCNDKQKYIKFMYIPAVFINIALNSLLIPTMGATGAAVASLVTQIATSILLPLCIRDLRPNAKLMLEAILLKNIH